MNPFSLALVSSLLLATLVITASGQNSEPTADESGDEVQDAECSDPDNCDNQKCCKHDIVEDADMVRVSCAPKPKDGTRCDSRTEYINHSN
uniref:Putative salivary secreted peptide n=1 Tax=Ixodes ricinus TaxID=34613 RepID=A0A090X866_IXORI